MPYVQSFTLRLLSLRRGNISRDDAYRQRWSSLAWTTAFNPVTSQSRPRRFSTFVQLARRHQVCSGKCTWSLLATQAMRYPIRKRLTTQLSVRLFPKHSCRFSIFRHRGANRVCSASKIMQYCITVENLMFWNSTSAIDQEFLRSAPQEGVGREGCGKGSYITCDNLAYWHSASQLIRYRIVICS